MTACWRKRKPTKLNRYLSSTNVNRQTKQFLQPLKKFIDFAQFFVKKKIIGLTQFFCLNFFFWEVKNNVRNFQEKKRQVLNRFTPPKKIKVFHVSQLLQKESAYEFYRLPQVKHKDVAFTKIYSTVLSQTKMI